MDSQLKERISKLSDEELREIVGSKSSDYRDDSIAYAAEELRARDVPFSLPANVEAYVCDACGADVSFEDDICPKCGADVSEVDDGPVDENAEGENFAGQTR